MCYSSCPSCFSSPPISDNPAPTHSPSVHTPVIPNHTHAPLLPAHGPNAPHPSTSTTPAPTPISSAPTIVLPATTYFPTTPTPAPAPTHIPSDSSPFPCHQCFHRDRQLEHTLLPLVVGVGGC